MKIQTIIDHLNTRIPLRNQEEWDNSGLLVGDPSQELTSALVALDLKMEVIDEAIRKGCNLIVTHHPILRSGIKQITPATEEGRKVMKLLQHGLCHYAAHTSLDNHPEGVSAILSRKLGLEGCRILAPVEVEGCLVGGGMIGLLPHPMPLDAFIAHTQAVLGIPCIRTSEPLSSKPIQRVALCGGSGAFLIGKAKAQGADLYMTGDLKYHDFQQAEGSIVLAEIGHYESEQFAQELLLDLLAEAGASAQKAQTRGGFIHYNT